VMFPRRDFTLVAFANPQAAQADQLVSQVRLSLAGPRGALDKILSAERLRYEPTAEELRGSAPISVELVAVETFPVASRRQFTPPIIRLQTEARSDYTCALYRDSAIQLRVIHSPETDAPSEDPSTNESDVVTSTTDDESEVVLTPKLLLAGWIPVTSWSRTIAPSSSNAANPIDGVFESRLVDERFDISELISLNRVDNQWTMETIVGFQPGQIPDFVDVEIPTVWCTNLTVEPSSLVYAQREGTDASRQILRIQCDPSVLDDATLSLTGRLQTGETGRVNVPSVQVLGAGNRRVYVDVPKRIDEEPIQWRTSAVEAIDLPDDYARPEVNRSTYLVASPSWSIDLAPLPEDDSGAIAVNADAQVFLRENGSLLLCHWDLYPGSLESVRIRLPTDAQCLGAWSAGRAVVPSIKTTTDGPKVRYLDLPLTISGLSQPVEVLLQLPNSTGRQTGYLPELVDVTVAQNWLVQFAPAIGTEKLPKATKEMRQQRAIAMARGVVEAVAAVNRVAQRPRDEVAAWLAMWVQRYQMIARSAGRTVDLEEMTTLLGDSPEEDSAPFPLRQSLPTHLQWKELDADLVRHLNRLLPPETATASVDLGDPASIVEASTGESMLFDIDGYERFVPQQVMALSAANRPRPIPSISERDLGLRTLIINLLTLILVVGLLMCLRPLQRMVVPILVHPAFWLALTGIFAFAVAPVAVAGALLLVAVTLPAFPSNR